MTTAEVTETEDPNPAYGLINHDTIDGTRYEVYHQPDLTGPKYLVGATRDNEPTRWFRTTNRKSALDHRI